MADEAEDPTVGHEGRADPCRGAGLIFVLMPTSVELTVATAMGLMDDGCVRHWI